MNDDVRPVLRQVVAQEGPALYADPRRCEALLKDLVGHRPAEIFVLVTAVDGGAPAALAANGADPASLADQLHASFGLDAQAAQWAIDSWAEAIGTVAPAAAGPPPEPSVVVPPPVGAPTAPPPVGMPVAPPPSRRRSATSSSSHRRTLRRRPPNATLRAAPTSAPRHRDDFSSTRSSGRLTSIEGRRREHKRLRDLRICGLTGSGGISSRPTSPRKP